MFADNARGRGLAANRPRPWSRPNPLQAHHSDQACPVYSLTRFRGHRNVALTLRSADHDGQEKTVLRAPSSADKWSSWCAPAAHRGSRRDVRGFPSPIARGVAAAMGRRDIKRLTLISDLAELGAAAPFPSAIK